MNVSLVCVGYRCPDLKRVLAPWLLVKEKHKDILTLNIAWAAAVFNGFGYDGYDNEENAAILREYEAAGLLKFIEIKDRKIKDFESRVACWGYLKQFPTDYVQMLDGDELYSYEQILHIFEFIGRDGFTETYRVNFKNYIGDLADRAFITDFKPLRIINNQLNGSFANFNHDNDGLYANGKATQQCSCRIVPQTKAFVEHKSWCYWDEESKERIKNKIVR